jgi:hypothetical protein
VTRAASRNAPCTQPAELPAGALRPTALARARAELPAEGEIGHHGVERAVRVRQIQGIGPLDDRVGDVGPRRVHRFLISVGALRVPAGGERLLHDRSGPATRVEEPPGRRSRQPHHRGGGHRAQGAVAFPGASRAMLAQPPVGQAQAGDEPGTAVLHRPHLQVGGVGEPPAGTAGTDRALDGAAQLGALEPALVHHPGDHPEGHRRAEVTDVGRPDR